MTRLNLTCPLYLTQNNGTIISAGAAREFPIKTFSSGATNSMRGAAYLCQRYLTGETIVLDIGGTTCDAGILLSSGLPKEASVYSTIAGVRINYTMPLLTSIGLGGGSVVRVKNGEVQIGPDSVGHALSSRGMAFGGDILTVTDIAICTGALDLSNTSVLAPLDETVVLRAQSKIATMLGKVVSEIKCTPAPVTVLMVGGGAVIAPDQISGVREIIRPLYHDIANAVGAAIAKVSGQVDVIETIGDRKLSTMIADCTERARQNCIRCGGDASTIVVADLQTMPIQYTTDQIRIIVTCVADLLEVTQSTSSAQFLPEDPPELYQPNSIVQSPEVLSSAIACCTDSSPDLTCYRPFIDTRRQWILSEIDLKLIAAGCYLLGCAGGGSPYSEYLQLRNMVRDGHICRVVDIDYLHPEDRVIYGGHMGSPAVSTERLSANEFLDAVHELLQYMRIDEYAAVMGLEIGGGNGLQPFLVGSSKNLNVPCLDADWMGRAFPTYYQTTLCVYNTRQLAPAAIASGNGQSLILTKANDDKIVDIALRAACSEMGSRVGMAAKPVSGQTVTKYAVKNTVSLAWRIGRVMHECRRTGIVSCIAEKIIEQIGGPQTAKKLYCGRITEVETRLVKAHSYGSLTIAPLGETHDYESSPPLANDGVLRIPYKNENILAEYESPLGRKEILASVPDLICVVDATSGENLGVPEYRYGLRVIVLAITASPRWTDTPEGLALGGPAAFGYDIPYKPIGVYVEPRSIIEEYGPASEIGKGAGA